MQKYDILKPLILGGRYWHVPSRGIVGWEHLLVYRNTCKWFEPHKLITNRNSCVQDSNLFTFSYFHPFQSMEIVDNVVRTIDIECKLTRHYCNFPYTSTSRNMNFWLCVILCHELLNTIWWWSKSGFCCERWFKA